MFMFKYLMVFSLFLAFLFVGCATYPKPEPGYTMYDQVKSVRITINKQVYEDKFTYYDSGELRTSTTYQSTPQGGGSLIEHYREFDLYGRLLSYTITRADAAYGGKTRRTVISKVEYTYQGPPKGATYVNDLRESGFNPFNSFVPYRLNLQDESTNKLPFKVLEHGGKATPAGPNPGACIGATLGGLLLTVLIAVLVI